MPTISEFYGILIRMYYLDHAPPHFHARVGGREAQVSIATGEVTRGSLPPTAARLVAEWAAAHRAELLENWRRSQEGVKLEKIEGLE